MAQNGAGLKYEDEIFAVRGAVFEVYREMGNGFLEAVYQECLAKELAGRGVPHVAQWELAIRYKGEALEQTYRPDFVCYDKLIVEIKAVKAIAVEHKAQVLNYLKVAGMEVGLLVNFGSYPQAQIERLIL